MGKKRPFPSPKPHCPVVEAPKRPPARRQNDAGKRPLALLQHHGCRARKQHELQTAVLPQPGLRYRLRLRTFNGDEVTLFDTASEESEKWQAVTIPLDSYAGTAVTIFFQVWTEKTVENETSGYWANPRLIVN
jgi:hypothetical protein